MKLKIKSNAEDLKASLELAQGHDQITSHYENSINKQEILREEQEIAEESYLYNAFKDMNIEISYVDTSSEDKKVKLIESKCGACKQRFLDLESYEAHIENCLIHHLDKFYLDSEELFREKVTEKINYHEYILRSIHSVRNISKRLFDFKYKKYSKTSKKQDELRSSSEENQEIKARLDKSTWRYVPNSRFAKKRFNKDKNQCECNFLSDHGYGSSSGSGQESKILT